MTKKDIIKFLFKWHVTILSCFSLIVILVTLLAYFIPANYEAKLTLIIEGNRGPVVRSDIVPQIEIAGVMNTEREILLSRSVMEKVIDEIRPHEFPEKETTVSLIRDSILNFFYDLKLLNPVDKKEGWIQSLMRKVDAEPLAMSYIMEISYKNKNAKLSAEILNSVANHYIEKHIQVFSASGIDDFYQKQTEQAKQKTIELRKELETYKQGFLVPAISDTRGSFSRTMSDLIEKSNGLKNELIQLKENYQETHPKITIIKKQLVDLDKQISKLQSRLSEIEFRENKIRQMEAFINTQNETYLGYLNKYENAKMTALATAGTSNVRIIEYAKPPVTPTHPRLFYIILAVIGGFGMAITLAILREYFDQRIENSRLAEEILEIPVLATIPVHKIR